MLNFIKQTIVIIITFISFISISHAHTYSTPPEIKNKSIIKIVSIKRTPNKLLPKELYSRTLGHTFKRRFAFENKIIKNVYFDESQPNYKLYAALAPTNSQTRKSRRYWP